MGIKSLFFSNKKTVSTATDARSYIKEAYQKLAEKYNQFIDNKPHNAYYDRPNTLSLFDEVEGKKILDAGCGPGKYAEILSAKGATVEAFDLSSNMIDWAKKRNLSNANFFIHDINNPLPQYQTDTFDYILCALSLDYVENWTSAMQEFNRLLKPNGKLIFSCMHPFFDFNYFKSKNYFNTELCSTVWKGFKKPVRVYSYRRSLQEIIKPLTINHFKIEVLLEPLPTDDFKQKDPIRYEKLMKFPAFLCIRASKV